MIISRRGFLKGMATSVAAATVPKLALGSQEIYTPPEPEIIKPKAFAVSRAPEEGAPFKPWDGFCDRLFHFDGGRRLITYVGETGYSFQDMYTTAKDMFCDVPFLNQYQFPLLAVTPEYGQFQGGWRMNPSSWDWMRLGCVLSENRRVKMVSAIGLSTQPESDYLAWVYTGEGKGQRVNPFNHVIRITEKTPQIKWVGIEMEYLYWEYDTLLSGFGKGPSDFFHSVTGSIRYPFHWSIDFNYLT